MSSIPTLVSITDNTGSPSVIADDIYTITLTFASRFGTTGAVIGEQPDTPTSTPYLVLSDGTATYVSGAGTDTLTFTYTPGSSSLDVTLTSLNIGESALTPSDLHYTGNNDLICFMAGTRIATPDGETAVEDLTAGDLVLTADGGVAPVRWLGRQTVSTLFADRLRIAPIRIRAGALGDAVPTRDLRVSPDHALLVDGVLVHAGALVNGASIVRETDLPRTFVYYHVELDDHALILAEGAPAETFIDNVQRLAFDNWAEHEALYPDGKPIVEMPLPRALAHRQVPSRLRARLAARAAALAPRQAAA